MLQTVIVTNTCHFPHRSVAFLAGETEIFSSSVKLVCQTLSTVFIQKLDATLKSMCQIRDAITSSVSFTFRENELAADNKECAIRLEKRFIYFSVRVVSNT